MIALASQVYQTYRNDKEPHRFRVFAQTLVAFTIAALGANVLQLPLTVMSLAISVLTGFSFTAMFSEPSTRLADLPAARDETDRADLSRLRALANNFRTRTNFFVVLAVFELLMMVMLVVRIELPANILGQVVNASAVHTVVNGFDWLRDVLSRVLVFLIVLFFLEWVYTFHRLSETILAILKIRSDYIEAHRPEG